MKSKAKKKKVIGFLISVIILIGSFLLGEGQIKKEITNIFGIIQQQEAVTPIKENKEEWHTVTKVADGDTFTVASGEKIRLIGVDTPESVHPDKTKNTEFGKVVSDFTREQLLDKMVRLEFDVSKTDRYDRILAYVYLEDGTFLNLHLVEIGYAKVMTIPPNVKHSSDFIKAEQQAKDSELGIWADYDNIFK